MVRAVTVQRLQRKLELAPLNAALGAAFALYLWPIGDFGRFGDWWGTTLGLLFGLSMAVDLWRRPAQSIAGVGAGIIALLISPVFSAFGYQDLGLGISIAWMAALALIVLGAAVNSEKHALERDPQKAITGVMNYAWTNAMHWTLHTVFFGSMLVPELMALV
jgi:hypothetical protein